MIASYRQLLDMNAHVALVLNVYEAARTYHNINTARIEVLFMWGLFRLAPIIPADDNVQSFILVCGRVEKRKYLIK